MTGPQVIVSKYNLFCLPSNTLPIPGAFQGAGDVRSWKGVQGLRCAPRQGLLKAGTVRVPLGEAEGSGA